MGLTGVLVKSVFSKNRSFGSHDSHVRNYGVDKRRWSSVRSYLCGDEFNSVLADADSASIRSSEPATAEHVADEEEYEDSQGEPKHVESSNITPSNEEENAAIVIQFAFRSFLVRRNEEASKSKEEGEREPIQEPESPSWESVGTSVEVQTGGSFDVVSLQEDRISAQNRVHQKSRSHANKLKDDWDDSTVSSNISKLRMQSRLEATTRRERALAYAFSQQLRVCSKKRSTQSDLTADNQNMGWSWLERWMATRTPETTYQVEDRMSKQNEPISRFSMGMNNVDLATEEKEESCGSNEVSIGLNRLTITSPEEKYSNSSLKPGKNRLKAAKSSISRRKTTDAKYILIQTQKNNQNKN
ncbi:hypothetical protein ACHQM5_025616 [Ranunculus cassubicifolius]